MYEINSKSLLIPPTSLHGWNLCFRPDKPAWHTFCWILIVFLSMTCCGVIMTFNILEFIEASVSFNLLSPTRGVN